MAYRKRTKRVLAGSLNLLAPGDLTPEADSLVLQNWRVDQAGQLRSRRGMDAVATGLTGGTIHSLYRSATRRYAGVGGKLLHGGAYATEVATGFDGAPLGLAAQGEFVWVMNRAKQGKAEWGTWSNWLIAPPAGALTVAAGGQASVAVAGFESSEDWDVRRFTDTDAGSVPVSEEVVSEAGTVAVTSGSTAIVGTGTAFTSAMVGANIVIFPASGGPVYLVVNAVTDATHLTVNDASWFTANASGLTYRIFREVAAWDYDTGNKVDGSASLHLACNPAGRWLVTKEFSSAKDLRIASGARAGDRFELWVYASDPEAVDSLIVSLRSGTGATLRTAVAEIAGAVLNRAPFSWTRVEIRRGLDFSGLTAGNAEYVSLVERENQARAAGDLAAEEAAREARRALFTDLKARSPYFRGPGSWADADGAYELEYDFNWAAVTEMAIQATVTRPCDLHYDQARVVGGVNGSLEGEFTYWVTFANDQEHESNPSPASATVRLSQQAATLTNIPLSADAQCSRRHVYRLGGGSGRALRVLTLTNNTATAAVDAVSVEDAQARNTPLPLDHDAPPAARGLVGPYFGRLVAFSSAAHPARLWWTPVAQPGYWPGAGDDFEGNWVDAGDERDELLHVTQHKRGLWLYKQRSIWRLDGDPERADPEPVSAADGILGVRAVANAGAVDYIATPQGIFRFNGDGKERISQKIDPLFRGDWVRIAGGSAVPPLSAAHASQAVLAYGQGRLYFCYAEEGQSTPSVTLVWDEETGRWAQHRLKATATFGAGGFTCLTAEHETGTMLGAAGGGIYELGRNAADAGQTLPLIWQSGYDDQGLGDNPKVYADLVLDHQTGEGAETPATLSVALLTDHGTEHVLGTISSGARTKTVFPLGSGQGVRGTNASVRVSGDAASTVTLHGVFLHYTVEAREGRSFDTGVFDLGSNAARECDAFELDVTTGAALSWTAYSDLPGNVVAQRATNSVAHAAGRRTVTVRLGPALGRRFRLVLTSTGLFQVHALRVRLLALGAYVDGLAGDVWEAPAV